MSRFIQVCVATLAMMMVTVSAAPYPCVDGVRPHGDFDHSIRYCIDTDSDFFEHHFEHDGDFWEHDDDDWFDEDEDECDDDDWFDGDEWENDDDDWFDGDEWEDDDDCHHHHHHFHHFHHDC